MIEYPAITAAIIIMLKYYLLSDLGMIILDIICPCLMDSKLVYAKNISLHNFRATTAIA